MRINDVENVVCSVLYLEQDDLVQGVDTDLRELGLDSLRLVLLLKRLDIEQTPNVLARISVHPTIATLHDVVCGANNGES